MAKKIKRTTGAARKILSSPFKIYWTKINYILFGIGIVLSIIGFYLLSVPPWDSNTSLVLSPIVLAIAYFIIFPLSIMYRTKEKQEEQA